MTDEFKLWWIHYVKKNTPKGYFHLPLTPKSINDLTEEEFELLDESEWELKTDNAYGIEYFLCKKNEEDNRLSN